MTTEPRELPIGSFDERFNVDDSRRVLIDIELISDEVSDKAGVVEFRALDKEGNRIELPAMRRRSERFGEYEYLAIEEAGVVGHVRYDLDLPEDVAELHLVGHAWGRVASPRIVGRPVVNVRGGWTADFAMESGRPLAIPAEYFKLAVERPSASTSLAVKIDFHGAVPDAEVKSPISVEFYDKNGRLLLPPGGTSVSPKLGSFLYLSGPPNTESAFETEIAVPTEVSTLVLQGHEWGSKTAHVIGKPHLEWRRRSSLEEATRFIDAATDDQALIILDTTAPPLGDESRALRPNNLAREYAKLGHRVIFFPFSTIQEQEPEVFPGVLQLDRKYFDDVVHAAAGRSRDTENYYICSSFGSVAAVATIDYLSERGWTCVYEIRDDMEEFNRVGYSKWYSMPLERRVIERAHRIVTVSPALAEKAESISPGSGRKVSVVPNAVREQIAENSRQMRDHGRWNTRPMKVGYVGHLTPSWFDWRLVSRAASRLSDIQFEIVGHGFPKGSRLPSNVEYHGAKTQEELLEIVQDWRVGIIPFIASPLTRGVDPNKLFEYLAWGLRVVSAPMGSVASAPSTTVYRDFPSFVEAIRSGVDSPMSRPEMLNMERYAERNTWDARAREMLKIMRGDD